MDIDKEAKIEAFKIYLKALQTRIDKEIEDLPTSDDEYIINQAQSDLINKIIDFADILE